jgi:hypothetical protein
MPLSNPLGAWELESIGAAHTSAGSCSATFEERTDESTYALGDGLRNKVSPSWLGEERETGEAM